MAKFEFDIKQLENNIVGRIGKIQNVSGNPAYGSILQRAGARLAEYFKGTLISLGKDDTGQLIDSIKPTDVKITGNNEKSIDVYPHGMRKPTARQRGVRNAMVGFVHEYGSSKVKASHWMSNTVDDVGDEIAQMVADGVSQIIENQLKGK